MLKDEFVSQCRLENRLIRFASRILPVLSSIPFLCILKNSLVLAGGKHTHNMMQPTPLLEIMKSGTFVICCIGFSPNITLCIQDKKFISLPHVL